MQMSEEDGHNLTCPLPFMPSLLGLTGTFQVSQQFQAAVINKICQRMLPFSPQTWNFSLQKIPLLQGQDREQSFLKE